MHEDGSFAESSVTVEKPALAVQILPEERLPLSGGNSTARSFHLELTSCSTSAGSLENIISHEAKRIWTQDLIQQNIHETMNLRNV